MDVDDDMDEELSLSRKFPIYPTSNADPTTVNRNHHFMDGNHLLDESRVYVSIVFATRKETNHARNSGANQVIVAVVIITNALNAR